MPMKLRQSSKGTFGTALPVKFRFVKPAVMVFTLTKKQRFKLILGYNVTVSVTLRMQNNPGVVDAESRIDVTEINGFEKGTELRVMAEAPRVEKEGSL